MTSTIDTTPATRAFPRRTLDGRFGTPVRDDGWRASDLAGQAAAKQLADLGAAGIYVNVFGVAYGTFVVHGAPVAVLASRCNPIVASADGTALVTRESWSIGGGNWLRVAVTR